MRRFVSALGALAILVTFFFATLLFLNYRDSQRTPDQITDEIRAEHARLLKSALEKSHAARGKYPILPDNDVSDLKNDLVGGGYLAGIPSDPLPGRSYRYASDSTGKTYGLLFRLRTATGKIPVDGACLTGARTEKSSFWANPPDCPF